ncbi:hypothetical protein DENIS_3038 [Desulfonema ishimotonii]|uniref:Uncharacterized protein n=1 Tax=Desulfonema ishimotonii TaxID=45657 RepID=A0A401FYP0_9BACT|nr:hypothetical protein DENIS_3038 [Desulfonema ishimotonii]
MYRKKMSDFPGDVRARIMYIAKVWPSFRLPGNLRSDSYNGRRIDAKKFIAVFCLIAGAAGMHLTGINDKNIILRDCHNFIRIFNNPFALFDNAYNIRFVYMGANFI